MVTFHGWPALASRPQRPDRLVFDLDPPDGRFDAVRDAARRVAAVMADIGMRAYVVTTGSRGLHVVAPLDATSGFDTVRAVAHEMAEQLAAEHPGTLTTAQRKNRRRGRLYLDVSRNAYGQTSVAPYSVRTYPAIY